MLKRQITHAMSVADVAGDDTSLKRYRNLRKRSAANGFSVRLIENIILSASCASFMTAQICKVRRASRFGWFSDRDAITTSYDGLAHAMYQSYTREVCQHLFDGWARPHSGSER